MADRSLVGLEQKQTTRISKIEAEGGAGCADVNVAGMVKSCRIGLGKDCGLAGDGWRGRGKVAAEGTVTTPIEISAVPCDCDRDEDAGARAAPTSATQEISALDDGPVLPGPTSAAGLFQTESPGTPSTSPSMRSRAGHRRTRTALVTEIISDGDGGDGGRSGEGRAWRAAVMGGGCRLVESGSGRGFCSSDSDDKGVGGGGAGLGEVGQPSPYAFSTIELFEEGPGRHGAGPGDQGPV
jgi:hypothetical protein